MACRRGDGSPVSTLPKTTDLGSVHPSTAIDTLGAVGIIECTASPSFGELVLADALGLALWAAASVLAVVVVYANRGRLRKWLG